MLDCNNKRCANCKFRYVLKKYDSAKDGCEQSDQVFIRYKFEQEMHDIEEEKNNYDADWEYDWDPYLTVKEAMSRRMDGCLLKNVKDEE